MCTGLLPPEHWGTFQLLWSFSVLFPQLHGKFQDITRKDGARPALPNYFLVLWMFRSVLCSSLCCSVHFLCVNVYWTTATWILEYFSTTLTEVFPRIFPQLQGKYQGITRKSVARLAPPNFFYCYVRSVLCILCTACVNEYCTSATGCQPNWS
jgi:hypothetical protein